jgi:hypothetical protein
MKLFKFLFLVAGVMITERSLAQNSSHLKLSDIYPTAGEKVRFTYNPIGTPLQDKTDIEASVYDMDYKKYSAKSIKLKPEGRLLKVKF